MEKKSEHPSLSDAHRLAKSPAGQQLLSTLQQKDPEAMQKAMEQLSKGNYSQIPQTLAPLLESEEIKRLLKQLGG